MKIIDKFLTLDLLKKINHKKNVFARERHLGYTNLSWQKELQTNSSLIFMMPFVEIEEDMRSLLVKELNDVKIKNMKIRTHMCVYSIGSLLTPHCDSKYYLGATVYINKKWSIENGGLFLYENLDHKTSNINVIVPKYNRCVVNYKHENHMVSQVTSNIQEPRFTIQIFVEDQTEDRTKNPKYSYI